MWSTAGEAAAPHDPTNRTAKPFPGSDVDYVKFRSPRLKPASIGVMMTSLRSLVRFLEFEERCHSGLSQPWPTVPNWKQPPPMAINPDTIMTPGQDLGF